MAFTAFGSTAPAGGGGFGGFGASSGAAGGFGAFGAAKPATTAFAPAGGFGGFGSAPSAAPATNAFGSTPSSTIGAFGATKPATTFGGFGSPAPSSTAAPTNGFGGFGSPSGTAAAPSFGGFGTASTTPAANGATTGFGGFGNTMAKPATTFSGFGTPAPATNLANGFGAPSTSGFLGFSGAPLGSGLGGFSSPAPVTAPVPAPALVPTVAAESVCEFPVETPYSELPAGYKAEIDRTWKDLKQPMKQKLEEISRSRGSIFDDVQAELRRVHLAVLKVENEQRRLQGEIRPFLAELKQTSETGRLQAAIGLQQIRHQDVGTLLSAGQGHEAVRNLIDEHLPCKWYLRVAEQLSARLNRCGDTIRSYERQLAQRIQALEQGGGLSLTRGSYGQVRRVGLAELVVLMQEQAKVFLQVTSAVAQVHQEVDALRQGYLALIGASNNGGSGRSVKAKVENPFEAAVWKDAAEQRVLEQRIQAESHKFHQQKQQQQNQQQPQSTPSTTAAPGQGLGGGFGGLSAPVSSFGATPGGFGAAPAPASGGFGAFGTTTATAAPTTASTGGFGGFGGALGGAAPATTAPTSGFGAPAMGGFGTAGSSSLGGKSSFAALDLATPNPAQPITGFSGFGAAATPGQATGGFGASAAAPGANPFGGFASSQAPALGASNPSRRSKKK